MTLTQKDRLNNDFFPVAQEVKFGDKIYKTPVIFEAAVAADASEGVAAFTAPFAMRLTDISVICTVAETNGRITPRKGSTAMCTAITCAVNKAVTRWSAGAEAAQIVLAKGDAVTLLAAAPEEDATAVRGIVHFMGVRL